MLIIFEFLKQVGTKLKDMRLSILSTYSTKLMTSMIIFKAQMLNSIQKDENHSLV